MKNKKIIQPNYRDFIDFLFFPTGVPEYAPKYFKRTFDYSVVPLFSGCYTKSDKEAFAFEYSNNRNESLEQFLESFFKLSSLVKDRQDLDISVVVDFTAIPDESFENKVEHLIKLNANKHKIEIVDYIYNEFIPDASDYQHLMKH